MKGLLIKDMKLILKQKSVFIIWVIMAVFLLFANEDPTFGICFSLFLMAMMLIGTISYDDFENGMGFLMTLPVSRKTYVLEKYVLMLGGSLLMGSAITCINVVYLVLHPEIMAIRELLLIFAISYLVSAVFSAIYLPFQLKFGAEKGRIILVVLGGIIFAVAILTKKAGPYLTSIAGDFSNVIFIINGISPMIWLLGVLFLTILMLGISLKVSVGIVEKEEY